MLSDDTELIRSQSAGHNEKNAAVLACGHVVFYDVEPEQVGAYVSQTLHAVGITACPKCGQAISIHDRLTSVGRGYWG